MGNGGGVMRTVRSITRADTLPFLIDIHYAHRMPSVSWSFGLFHDEQLEGVITYGTPSSAPLRRGICGDSFKHCVVELNRLCLRKNLRNDASFLVSHSLKMLRGNKIVISFADTSQGHVGTVYQASNFIYCGLSAKRTDWKIKGMEHLHGQTIADEFRGHANRAQAMRDKYGDDFYLHPRPLKHRYLKIIGHKKFKVAAMAALRYAPRPYPQSAGK